VTEEYVRRELTIPLNDVITANCLIGEFTDFRGNRYRFLGPSRKTGDFMMAKYSLMNLSTREIADGSMARRVSNEYGDLQSVVPCSGAL
jgi:hypothetical protein